MKIKRTWKEHSNRAGDVEIIDEAKMREIAGQTVLAQHGKGECANDYCSYCPEPAMKRLLAGAKLDQYFCTFELIEA